jgi:hypothetical protein
MPLSEPDVSYAIPLPNAELCARYLLEADHTPCTQYRTLLGLTGTGDATPELLQTITQAMENKLRCNGDSWDSVDEQSRLVLIM